MSSVVVSGFGGRGAFNSAANLSSVTQFFAGLVAEPGEWTIISRPAANTQATVTKAAGGTGVRHVLRSITASFINTAAAAGAVEVVVRDGASGVGTILYIFFLAIPAIADSSDHISLSDLNIVGSPNTAMTVEFTGAGGATTNEDLSGSGYSTQ